MTADEAAVFLRLDRKSVYNAVLRQEIPHRRIGRRVLLSRAALVQWLAGGMRLGSPAAYAAPQPSVEPPPPAPPPRPTPIDLEPWRWRGTARRSAEQINAMKEIAMKAVEAAPGRGAKDYAKATGMTSSDVGLMLGRLLNDGRLAKLGRGPLTTYRPRMS